MHFHLTQLTLLLLLPLTVLSQAFQNTTRTFYTRTHRLSGNKAFANLYPQTYHTGAGTSAVTLTADRDVSLQSYIYNSTRLNVFRTHEFPWGWWAGVSPYARWGDVGVNAGLPDGGEGFALVKSGKNTVVKFQGGKRWLVCQWWFQVPQAFWLVDWETGTGPGEVKVPEGCAVVEFVVEWI